MRNVGTSNSTKKHSWLIFLGSLGLFLLFSHQNCAPPAAHMASAGASVAIITPDSAGPVTIIDESKSTAGLSFSFGDVLLGASASDLRLPGHCSTAQEGAVLAWNIYRVNADGSLGTSILEGKSVCEGGGFILESASTALACGDKYRAVARLGLGVPGEVSISKSCH